MLRRMILSTDAACLYAPPRQIRINIATRGGGKPVPGNGRPMRRRSPLPSRPGPVRLQHPDYLPIRLGALPGLFHPVAGRIEGSCAVSRPFAFTLAPASSRTFTVSGHPLPAAA